MSVYNTVQRRELIAFLQQHKQEGFTVVEIENAMNKDPQVTIRPSQSTLYRLIKELVEEGLVRRSVKGNSRKFVYQITDGEQSTHHLHMKCMDCGKVYHMNDEQSKQLVEKILDCDSFEVDSSTVLVGKCADCRK
ncbi:MAG: transcriptional repressor [Ruminococcus sp.]|nr:transcriptional repressor [Ruminococcus sp.]